MYELKKIGKVFTSKFVGTGPSSYKKRIYRAAASQRLRNTGLEFLGVKASPCFLRNVSDNTANQTYFQGRMVYCKLQVEQWIISSLGTHMENAHPCQQETTRPFVQTNVLDHWKKIRFIA